MIGPLAALADPEIRINEKPILKKKILSQNDRLDSDSDNAEVIPIQEHKVLSGFCFFEKLHSRRLKKKYKFNQGELSR